MKDFISNTYRTIKMTEFINCFSLSSRVYLYFFFTLRTLTMLGVRTLSPAQPNSNFVQYLQIGRKSLYFYELESYIELDKNNFVSAIISIFIILLLLFSFLLTKLQRKILSKYLSEQTINKLKAKINVIFLAFYTISYIIFGFGLNFFWRAIQNGQIYLIPLPTILIILTGYFIFCLEFFSFTINYTNKSLLSRSYDSIMVIRAICFSILSIYNQLRPSPSEVEFSYISILICILFCIELGNCFQKITFYREITRKLYFLSSIIGIQFNLWFFISSFKFDIVNENLAYSLLSSIGFMYMSVHVGYNHYQSTIITKDISDFKNQNQALMYMIHAGQLIEKINDKTKQIQLLSMLVLHRMQCKQTECFCKKRMSSLSKEIKIAAIQYFADKFESITQFFNDNLTLSIVKLHFKLQFFNKYHTFLADLNQLINDNDQRLYNRIVIWQATKAFQDFFYERQAKQETADTQIIFQLSQRKQYIFDTMNRIVKALIQKWKLNTMSTASLNNIENKLNEALEGIREMEKHKKWYEEKKVKSPQYCKMFIFYYSTIICLPKRQKSFKEILSSIEQFLIFIQSVTIGNIRNVIFSNSCCTIQSPINYQKLGYISNCTYNCQQIFNISKSQFIGKKINMVMPQTLSTVHDSILKRWMQTGYNSSLVKLKRVYAIRLSPERELFEADVYMKAYYNQEKRILNFILSFHKKENDDLLLVNQNLKIEGYGMKIGQIFQGTALGQLFSNYNKTASKLFNQSKELPIRDEIKLKVAKNQGDAITQYSYRCQYHSIQIFLKKMLVINFKQLLKKTIKIKGQFRSSFVRIQAENQQFIDNTKIEKAIQDNFDSKQHQQFCQSISEKKQIPKTNITDHVLQDTSSTTDTTTITYSLTKIMEDSFEKSNYPKKIKSAQNSIFCLILTVSLTLANLIIVGQAIYYDNSLNSALKVLKSETESSNIVILQAIYYAQVQDYELLKPPFFLPQTIKMFMEASTQIKNRIYNKVTKDFGNINSKVISNKQLNAYLKYTQPMQIGNSVAQSNFLFLCLLFHTATHEAFESYDKVSKINEYKLILSQNWKNTIELAMKTIPKTFQYLGSEIITNQTILIILVSITFLLSSFTCVIAIISQKSFQGKKKKWLCVNQYIPIKYSEYKKNYYTRIATHLGRMDIQNIQLQPYLDNIQTFSKLKFTFNSNKWYALIFVFITIITLVPHCIYLSKMIYSERIIKTLNKSLFQSISSQQAMFLNSQNVRSQISWNGFGYQYGQLKPLQGLSQQFSMGQFFQSITQNISVDNKAFQIQLNKKLNQDVCELIASYSTKRETEICNLQLKQALLHKGIIDASMTLQTITKETIKHVQTKTFNLASFGPKEFAITFLSDYFLFVGLGSLTLWCLEFFQQNLQSEAEQVYILCVVSLLLNCLTFVSWWWYLYIYRSKEQAKLYGYTILLPAQLIRENKVILRNFEQSRFKSQN